MLLPHCTHQRCLLEVAAIEKPSSVVLQNKTLEKWKYTAIKRAKKPVPKYKVDMKCVPPSVMEAESICHIAICNPNHDYPCCCFRFFGLLLSDLTENRAASSVSLCTSRRVPSSTIVITIFPFPSGIMLYDPESVSLPLRFANTHSNKIKKMYHDIRHNIPRTRKDFWYISFTSSEYLTLLGG